MLISTMSNAVHKINFSLLGNDAKGFSNILTVKIAFHISSIFVNWERLPIETPTPSSGPSVESKGPAPLTHNCCQLQLNPLKSKRYLSVSPKGICILRNSGKEILCFNAQATIFTDYTLFDSKSSQTGSLELKLYYNNK